MTMAEPARCFALIPCAGAGERAGAALPKQYARLAGRSLVCHTLRAIAQVARIEATLVVIAPDDAHFESQVPATQHDRRWLARCGGATRAQSVANGLAELRRRGVADGDWVLVHDAARCLVSPAAVERLINACIDDEVGGLLAAPVADTLKRADADRAAGTVDRRDLWAAQTPQMFRLGLLERALAAAGSAVTDDASAVEQLGLRPLLVASDWSNLKVTWPADLMLAERLLEDAT